MPHLHAEDCPERENPWCLYREDHEERQQFDRRKNTFRHPLEQVAMALDIWGRMNVGGSYSEQCFIMANECLKAAKILSDGALGRQDGTPDDASGTNP